MLDRRYDSISSDWVHKQYSDARPSKSRTTEVFLILLVIVLLALLGGRLPLPWKASATAQTAARSTIPVWVNPKSGFYYCPDSKSYGKLKHQQHRNCRHPLDLSYFAKLYKAVTTARGICRVSKQGQYGIATAQGVASGRGPES